MTQTLNSFENLYESIANYNDVNNPSELWIALTWCFDNSIFKMTQANIDSIWNRLKVDSRTSNLFIGGSK